MLIAEAGAGLIKRLDGDQLTVVAGTTKGYAGDGGPATAAKLESVVVLAYQGEALYAVCHQSPRIRRIGADGIITTVAKDMPKRWMTAVAAGPAGELAVADGDNHTVHRFDGATHRLIAGKLNTMGDAGDGGPAADATMSYPFGLLYGPDGTLYVAEAGNCVIRKIAPDGTISTFAGKRRTTLQGMSYTPGQDDGGPASEAVLMGPGFMTWGPDGSLYVVESGTFNLRLSGVDTALLEGLPQVAPRVRKITPDGKIQTVAGPGGKWFKDASDGFGMIAGLVIDKSGRLFISDAMRNQVRIVPAGTY